MLGYYEASMLALLKPWRDLRHLKNDNESWKTAYDEYMQTAIQRDRDVVAGCQYYYDSRSAIENRDEDEEVDRDVMVHSGEDSDDVEEENELDECIPSSVSENSNFEKLV